MPALPFHREAALGKQPLASHLQMGTALIAP